MNNSESIQKLKIFWETPRNRHIVVGLFLIVFGYPIYSAIVGTETRELEVMKAKDADVIEPLYSNSISDIMDKEEATETWDAAREEIREEKHKFMQQEVEYEKRMVELEEENSDMTMEFKKMQQQLNTLLKIKGSGRGQIIDPQNKNGFTSTEVNGATADDQQEFATQGGFQNQNQNVQIISRPMFTGDVVRTITQNKMREVRSGSDITETNLNAKVITESSQDNAAGVNPATAAKAPPKKKEDLSVYLPAGSLISGTLITGLDAPTQLSKNTAAVPVMMRVKKEAILPNYFSLDIRECRIIGSAIGNLSSKRVDIRSELISCVREDGGAIEVNLDGYAVSSFDGKAGVKGRLVQRNGDMIMASVRAGFLQGFSQMVAPQRVSVLSTDSGADPFQQIDFGNAAKSAGLKGAGNAMERVADYYIKLAEETFPVIELNPGIEIDFVIKRGAKLQLH